MNWLPFRSPIRCRDGKAIHHMRIKRRGFCVWALSALESMPSGTVHFISHQSHRMAWCGFGAKSKPGVWRMVRKSRITCLRCLTCLLLTLNREGSIAEARP
jgi:hypothetical protein